MRVYKHNVAYVPFHQAVEEISSKTHEPEPIVSNDEAREAAGLARKYSYYFQVFLSFEEQSERAKDIDSLIEFLLQAVKRILTCKEAGFLFFDENRISLKSVSSSLSHETIETINNYYREGVFNLLFDGTKPIVVPQLSTYNVNGSRLNYVVLPVFEENQSRGVFTLLATAKNVLSQEQDRQFLEAVVRLALSKMNRFMQKAKVLELYEEVQVYQAKLSNDFRLASIGELTQGIVEDILSPLQIIMMHADLLKTDDESGVEVKRIKTQVQKIQSVINRLVKFASLNQKEAKIASCDLNGVIKEYYDLVKTTLEGLKLECVLDFENDIPPILTHPIYIHQVLANIFGLIRSNKSEEIGVVLQTRHVPDALEMRLLCTIDVSELTESARQSNLTFRIIENLMRKHEGFMKIESFRSSGSLIVFHFPLIRKVRV